MASGSWPRRGRCWRWAIFSRGFEEAHVIPGRERSAGPGMTGVRTPRRARVAIRRMLRTQPCGRSPMRRLAAAAVALLLALVPAAAAGKKVAYPAVKVEMPAAVARD